VAMKGVHCLWVVWDGEKRFGVLWIVVSCETYEILSVEWFQKLSDTLEPSLWIHSPG
jgi:hypothetical protein